MVVFIDDSAVWCGEEIFQLVAEYGRIIDGIPRLEVFSIRVNNLDNEDTVKLYGTIMVDDCLLDHYIYNRESNDYESIRSGEMITLTGPSQSFSACREIIIDFHLWDYNRASPHNEISRKKLYWRAGFGLDDDTMYDVPLLQNVEGKYGSLTLNYMLFRSALRARIEVTLVNVDGDGDGEDSAVVYGLVAAHGNQFGQESVLFQRKSDNYITVRRGAQIPLLRSVVAVSVYSSLTVRADLYEIANGSVEFTVQSHGTYTKNIIGKYWLIEIKVTWAP